MQDSRIIEKEIEQLQHRRDDITLRVNRWLEEQHDIDEICELEAEADEITEEIIKLEAKLIK